MKWLIGVTAASVLSGCVWLMPVDSALKYSHGRHIGRIADRLGLPQERGLVTRQNGELTEVWSWRASRDLYQEKATYLTGEVKTDKGKMPFSGKSYTYEPAGTASCTISFSLTTRESSMRLTTAHRCRPRRATACSCVCRPSSGRTATAAAACRHHGRHAVPAEVVPETGIEPVRPCGRGIFVPLRLSPPARHAPFVVWSTPSP